MSYDPYSQPYGQQGQPAGGMPYPAPQPQRRRRGLKRLIFGILGIIANAIGLFVLPFIAVLGGAVVGLLGMTPAPLSPDGGTFETSAASIYYIAAPADEASSTTCEFDGQDLDIDHEASALSVGEIDGVEYESIYTVISPQNQQVTVHCEGATTLAVAEVGIVGMLISTGVGVIIPIVLGLLALILTIWGIIALVRSS